jgi:hypothetical protein
MDSTYFYINEQKMPFIDLNQKYIELNLDNIFDENGYINPSDEEIYQKNKFVEKIKLIRTKNNPLKIGDWFLCECKSLITIDLSSLSNVIQIGKSFLRKCKSIKNIDLSPLSNITHIGCEFLYDCEGVTTIDISHLSNVKHIGNNFLSGCKSLTNINLSPLSNVTQIRYGFLYGCKNITNIDLSPLSNVIDIGVMFLGSCENITNIDLSPLSNVSYIGSLFLGGCKRLTYVIVNEENEYLINKIKETNPNIEIKTKNTIIFRNYEEDKDKIRTDRNFAEELMEYLEIEHKEENSHENLQETLRKIKEEYDMKMNDEDLNICINNECIFTMEELKNVPKKKLIMIDEHNGKYYCFDVITLRNFIFQKQNNKYENPYTRSELKKEDIDKILKVDIKKIKYFG